MNFEISYLLNKLAIAYQKDKRRMISIQIIYDDIIEETDIDTKIESCKFSSN